MALTFYFGAVDGGVWKTTDAGMTWKPIFDGQPVASIGALRSRALESQRYLCRQRANPTFAPPSAPAMEFTNPPTAARPGRTSACATLARSAASSSIPRNPDIVYVGALGHAYGPNDERGVYKSTDGGATWKHVLDKGPSAGVSDLAIAAGKSEHSLRRHLECASSAVEHLCSAARPGQRPVSLHRQRANLDAAYRATDFPMATGAASASPSLPTAIASTR